jgi:hypothetical protein
MNDLIKITIKMKPIVVLTAILALSLFSCKEQSISTEFEGRWDLVNYSGGFAGVNEDVAKDSYTFTFTSETVTVKNNHDSFVWIAEGTYSYSISGDEDESLIINDQDLGLFIKTGAKFTVDQRADDGFKYVFSK